LAAAGAALVPLLSLTPNAAQAREHKRDLWDDRDDRPPFGSDPDLTKCCFLRGTQIGSPTGETPIEQLQIGDEICTLDGNAKVKWLGYDRFRAPDKVIEGLTPIRVARFAIDDETPVRDLYLSPRHCLFADGLLIPIEYLQNGTSIAYCTLSGAEWIEYYHIECDRHEIVFAEGAAVESYRGVNRETFQNQATYERVHGRDIAPMPPYAPVVGYHGGLDELRGLVTSIVSNIIDVRDPIQIVGDRLDERARRLLQ
jgi:hypothetical protein